MVPGQELLGDRMLQWGLWAGIVSGAAMLALSPVLPDVFSDDPAVLGLATFLLIHVGVNQPMNGVAFVLDGILIGAGDLRFLARATAVASMILTAAAFGVLGAATGSRAPWGRDRPPVSAHPSAAATKAAWEAPTAGSGLALPNWNPRVLAGRPSNVVLASFAATPNAT